MKNEFVIPEYKLQDVKKGIKRIISKARKYGADISVSYGAPYEVEQNIKVRDDVTHTESVIGTRKITAVTVCIDSDIIRCGNWSVVSMIDHMNGGNVVHGVYQPEFATMAPYCAHCGCNHGLKRTFIVHDGAELRQVGSRCLLDYTGIDPKAFLASQELSDLLLTEDAYHEDSPRGTALYVLQALAAAIRVYKANGYVRSGEAGENKALIPQEYRNVTSDDIHAAQEISDYILSMDSVSSLVGNLQTLCRSGYCNNTHLGFIAYAPVLVERDIEAQKRKQARLEAESVSEFVGQIGQRIRVNVSEVRLVTSTVNQFGWSGMYKMTTTDGNTLIWWTGSDVDTTKTAWDVTIKSHDTYNGNRQTAVTRCKAARL